MLVPKVAQANSRAVGNAPLDDNKGEKLITIAQLEARKSDCSVCGISQEAHWKCACCGARGHHIPPSIRMPGYCSWCEVEGCAERHQAKNQFAQAV